MKNSFIFKGLFVSLISWFLISFVPNYKTVTGRVFDENKKPLANVEVINTNNSFVALTNNEGYFEIRGKKGEKLKLIHSNKVALLVKIRKQNNNKYCFPDPEKLKRKADRKLKKLRRKKKKHTDKDHLDEVHFVKYGAERKESITGAVMSTDAAVETVKEKSSSGHKGEETNSPVKKPGQLTAGEVNDFSHWEYWQGLTQEGLKIWTNTWKMEPKYRFSISIKNSQNTAVIDQKVYLMQGSTLLWSARTDNMGKAELWANPFKTKEEVHLSELTIVDEKDTVLVKNPKEFHEGINAITLQRKCTSPNKINIAFMIDATGSMGDEISYLQAELYDVITRAKENLPDTELKLGSVFYRDKGDDYLTKNFDFSENISQVSDFIKKQKAGGGGDYPEAVVDGLEQSINMLNWDEDARAKLLFVLLDAPPHKSPEDLEKLKAMAVIAAAKGIKIVPVAASGINKSTEYLMRALALQTNGTYLFITNHSGIGNKHIEPSTESYKVEMLNDLILRIILQNTEINKCDSTIESFTNNLFLDDKLDSNETFNWSVFPNPTKGKITITLPQKANAVSIFDTTGKLILFSTKNEIKYQFDLSDLPNAIYYVKIDVNGKTYFKKIIKR